jgi:hypothetical protein
VNRNLRALQGAYSSSLFRGKRTPAYSRGSLADPLSRHGQQGQFSEQFCAVLLAPNFRPLISEPRLFEELNAATEGLYVDKPIHFETVTISGYPQNECGDFEFSNVQSKI